MVKVHEIKSTSTFAWSSDKKPLLVTGTVAGAVDANFSSASTLEITDVLTKTTLFSTSIDAKLHALDWSAPFESYTRGLIAGAFENGIVHLWDAAELLSSQDLAKAIVSKSEHHTGPVRALQFNPLQPYVLATTGSRGEIFVWDTKKLSAPFRPGQAMSPMEDVTCVAWNNSVPHIFATAGSSGFASIWDLKAKREVLHLSYSGASGRANLATVAWHPTQSTKLVTASDNDGTPLILTWDLRNANAPEKIMEGHTKGVLSLDWCKQDPELLLSSGKDNCTSLWNPIAGTKLGEYPTTANWAFKTRFAPAAPDLFATASFDGTISVQTLQDTLEPVSTRVKSTNEDDFWSQISTTDTQQPQFAVKQAPRWLKNSVAVSFGFGGKLVIVKNNMDDKTAKIVLAKIPSSDEVRSATEKLSSALTSGDFQEIITARVATGSGDWKLLQEVASGDKLQLLNKELKGAQTLDEEDDDDILDSSSVVEDSFFDKLASEDAAPAARTDAYAPTGTFTVDAESPLVRALLAGKLEDASNICLKEDRLVEALMLALNGTEAMKAKARNAYFAKHGAQPVARVLFSAAQNDAHDLVANAEVANWRETAAAIKTYATSDAIFNAQITQLGDRILVSGETSETRAHAIACYVAGGALDKLSQIWLAELPALEHKILESGTSTSPSEAHLTALGDFVEKVSVYRAAFRITGELEGKATADAYLQYATILAGFGNFDLADKFLQLLPGDIAGLKLEKERITKASSKPAAKQQARTGHRQPQFGYAPVTSAPVSPVRQQQGLYAPVGAPVPAARVSVPVSASPAARVSVAPPSARPNPYAPTALGSIQAGPASSPPAPSIAGPPPVTSSQNPTKDNGGWNDLPTTFNKHTVRRAAPAAVASSQPVQQPLTPHSRVSSFTQQAPLPPPRAPTIKSPQPVEPTPAPPKPTNRYAPPPQLAPTKPASVSAPPMPTPPAANPYAPPTQSAPTSRSQPQTPGYGPPPIQAFTAKPNPYAQPQSQGSAYAPAPPQNGFAQANGFAPPSQNFQLAPPPKMTLAPVAPPPIASPPVSTPPVTAAKHASGNREHLSDTARPVFATLSAKFAEVKPLMPESRAKQVNDTEKRLNILYDHLNNGELSDAVVGRLGALATALEAKNLDGAQALYGEISTAFSADCGDWAVGVKRLIGMVSAVALLAWLDKIPDQILILSIGNPGAISRHSIGHYVLNQLHLQYGLSQLTKSLALALSSATSERLTLCKSETYMNESGTALRNALQHPAALGGKNPLVIVLYDDFEINSGKIKFTKSKSNKKESHNGLKDLNKRLLGYDKEYQYLKIGVGIGPKPANSTSNTMSKWILSTEISLSDKQKILTEALPLIVEIIDDIIEKMEEFEKKETRLLNIDDINPDKMRSRLVKRMPREGTRENTPSSVLYQ
ncbi:hypothetical protein BABINDRAFT_9901 [Babjeviella inositovora NRRL Y-12698]|uniref:Protein transport protein SEC31 n=1 Tax=Babjeviella inositovora NRRL Y-12698 TaxID=984486 RepID=A0A1E3QLS4_9ASCO|nr:uncharacterized protein BABINDRAFT_9901 [Babjeviella inositovora NRRL Y-12698]ODQ77927.1 hypothetical protein BABINDRAFT_9901 [Babjeviella inositovora NRRL Y-12698]